MSSTELISIFLISEVEIALPKIGIAFLRIAIASKTPSQSIIGKFQLIKFSKNIMSLEASGFLYL